MVSEPQADTLDLLIADHKGEVTFRRGAAEAKAVAFGTHHGRGGPGRSTNTPGTTRRCTR